ncbi:MAG: WD40 repeat domain-containing protein [Pirellulales bacterium]
MKNRHYASILCVSVVSIALVSVAHRSVAQDAAQQAAKTDEQAKKQQPLAVRCLAFSPDGRSLAAGYGNNDGRGRVIAWDLAQRKPRFAKEEGEVVPSVAYSPNGEFLAIGSFLPVVRLLNPATGNVMRAWKAHDQHIRSVAFNFTGTLATASYDQTIKLWDAPTGTVRRVLAGHQAPLRVIAFSPDGKWLASAGGQEEMVRLWNLTDQNKPPREFKMEGYVPQVAFSPDSSRLAVSVWVEGPVLFDVNTGKERDRLTNLGGIHWTTYSPDGRWLAVATNGRDVYIFPAQHEPTEAEQREIARLIKQFEDDDYAKREAASKRLAELGGIALPQIREGLKSESAEVRIRCRRLVAQAQSGANARKLTGHGAELECLAFSPDGRYLASGDWQGTVIIWDVEEWKSIATLGYTGN